jgi:hypothetical protein
MRVTVLLCDCVGHPRFDCLPACPPKREIGCTITDRLEVVPHDIVVVDGTLCLQLGDSGRISQNCIRTNR